MKIERLKAHVLHCDVEQPFQSSFSTFHGRWACLVEIICDDGTVGWGECLGPAKPNAALVAAMAPVIIGRDPLDIEPIWSRLYNEFRDQGQHGITMTAQSGIDIALWDIAGKHFGMPVHRLAGGAYRTEVPAYATGGFRPVGQDHHAWVTAEAARYVSEGFKAVKIKIGYDVREDANLIAAVRDAIGSDTVLMVDANHGYDAIEAIQLGNKVAHLDIDWFEEPVQPELLAAYGQVRARQPIPVAGGETWHGRKAFTDAIRTGTVDILQPDVCACGGITEMRKIVALAETDGVRMQPHVWGTAVAIAASLHVLATLPPAPMSHRNRPPWLEFDQTEHAYRLAIATEEIVQQGGTVQVPDGPGLGIEIDRNVLAEFTADPD